MDSEVFFAENFDNGNIKKYMKQEYFLKKKHLSFWKIHF